MAENQNNVLRSTLKSYRSSEMMTIPQLRQAKEIIRNKKSQVNDALVSRKLESMYAEYEKQERKINKFYQKCVYHKNPAVREYVRGKRYLLQAIDVKRISRDGTFKDKFFRQKGEKWDYNVADFLRDVKADKIALGVGVGVMGLGVASIKMGQDSIMEMIGKALQDFITNNPAAFGMLVAGTSLIALSKIIPSIDKKVQKAKSHAALYRSVKNDITNETFKDESGFDRTFLSNANFAKSKDKIVNDLYNFPNLKNAYEKALYDPNSILTNSEKRNLIEALKEANNKIDDYERIKDGRKTRAEEQADNEVHQKQVEKFEEVKSLISNFDKKVSLLNENSFDQLKTLQNELMELSEKSKQVTESELSNSLSEMLLSSTEKLNVISDKIQENKKEIDKNTTLEIQNTTNTTISNISKISSASTTTNVQNIQNTISELKKKAESITDPTQKEIALNNLKTLESAFNQKTKEVNITVSKTNDNSSEKKEIKDKELEEKATEDDKCKEIEDEIDALSTKLNNEEDFTIEKYEETEAKYNKKFEEFNSKISQLKNQGSKDKLNETLNIIKDEFNGKVNTAKKGKSIAVLRKQIRKDLDLLENAKESGKTLNHNTEEPKLSNQARDEIIKRIEENISKLKDNDERNAFTNELDDLKTELKTENTLNKNDFNNLDDTLSEIQESLIKLENNNASNASQELLTTIGNKIAKVNQYVKEHNLSNYSKRIEEYQERFNKISEKSRNKQNNPKIDRIRAKFNELDQDISKLNSKNIGENSEKIDKSLSDLSKLINSSTTTITQFKDDLKELEDNYHSIKNAISISSDAKEIHQSLDNIDTNKFAIVNIYDIDSTYNDFNNRIKTIDQNIQNFKSKYPNDKQVTEIEEHLKSKKQEIETAHSQGLDQKANILQLEANLDQRGREVFAKAFSLRNQSDKDAIDYVENLVKDMYLTVYQIGDRDPVYSERAKNKMEKIKRVIALSKDRMLKNATPEEKQAYNQELQENAKRVKKAFSNLELFPNRFESFSFENNSYERFTIFKNKYLDAKKEFETLNLDENQSKKFVNLTQQIEKTYTEKESIYIETKRTEITSSINNLKIRIQDLPTHLEDFEKETTEIKNAISEIEKKDEKFTLEEFTIETKNLRIDFEKQKQIANHKLLVAEIESQFNAQITNSNIYGIINNVNKNNYKSIENDFKTAYTLLSNFVNGLENSNLVKDEKSTFERKLDKIKESFDKAVEQAKIKEQESRAEIKNLIAETQSLINNFSNNSTDEDVKNIENNLSIISKGQIIFKRDFISLNSQFSTKKKEYEKEKQIKIQEAKDQKLINDIVKSIENEISGLTKVDKQVEGLISEKIANLSNLPVFPKFNNTLNNHIADLNKKLDTKKQENLERDKIFEQQKKDNETYTNIENSLSDLENLLSDAKKVNIENEIKNGHSVDGVSLVIDKFYIARMNVKNIEKLNQGKYEEYVSKIEALKPAVDSLQNRIDKATKKAETVQAEKENKTYQETAKIEADTKKEKYEKLITYTIREYRDCLGYDIAQKKKRLEKGQNYLDLLDYIHNKLGITSEEARAYLNQETGEFIEHKMTSYFTPEKDAKLGELFYKFKRNTITYNKLCEKSDECNQSILHVKHRASYRQLVNQVARTLKISEDEAMKLVNENGELSGQAANNKQLLDNNLVRNLQAKIKSAKKEYDDYLASDWGGRQDKVPEILNWKLADVRQKYKNMVNNIGKVDADKNCVSACIELKADINALEKLIDSKIETRQVDSKKDEEDKEFLRKSGTFTGVDKPTKKDMSIETLEVLVRKKLENQQSKNIISYATLVQKTILLIKQESKDYYVSNKIIITLKQKLLDEYEKANPTKVSQSTITFETIEKQVTNLLNECKNDKKSGINQEVIDKKIETVNNLIESSKQLSPDEIKKLQEIKKSNIAEINTIKAENEQEESQKENKSDEQKQLSEEEIEKKFGVTKDDVKALCESYCNDYYDAIAKSKTILDYEKKKDSIENSLNSFNAILADGEKYFGKEFADEIRATHQEDFDFANELKAKLPKYTKEEYEIYLKTLISEYRENINKKDPASISRCKELKEDYKNVIKDAKKDFGGPFIATLKDQSWKEIFEGKENATTTNPEVTSLQDAFKGLDTNSFEFKTFIKSYQKLYVTLSASNNSKDYTTQKFNELAEAIEKNTASLTDKQLEVAKYLIEVAKSADAKTREQTANNPKKIDDEQQEKQAKENRINKMIEDGYSADDIAKVFGDSEKALILDLIKQHNKKLEEEKAKLQQEIEREM